MSDIKPCESGEHEWESSYGDSITVHICKICDSEFVYIDAQLQDEEQFISSDPDVGGLSPFDRRHP